MPKGSKKRKADKKKKEKASNSQSPTNCQGNDDLKSHDEKDSDGGEVSSPLSQDNPINNHGLVGEGERQEQGKRDFSSVLSDKPMERSENGGGDGKQQVETVDVEVIEVVRDSKRDGEEDSNNRKVVDVIEFVKESVDDGSSGDAGSSSNSSSSDDESRQVEKTVIGTETAEFEEQKGVSDLAIEAVSSVDSTGPVVTEAVTTQVVEITGTSDVIESQAVEAVVLGNSGVSDVIEITSKVEEEKMLPLSDEKAMASSVSDLVSVGTEDKKLPLLNENDVAPGVTDLGSIRTEDKVLRPSEENIGMSAGTADLRLKEKEDNLSRLSDAPSVEISNVREHGKEFEIPESSENQPLIPSGPQPLRPTSWKSCCGLFDVLTGSRR